MQTLKVKATRTDNSNVPVGTRAARVLASIVGVTDVEVIAETETEAELRFAWEGQDEPFYEIQERLAAVNLQKVQLSEAK